MAGNFGFEPKEASVLLGQGSPYAITERIENGLLILSPVGRPPLRRVLFLNSYGGKQLWCEIKAGVMPSHHLWGCTQLVGFGYEVAIAEPLRHFTRRRPLPHDLALLRAASQWLGPTGILYCAHTLLYWLPLLRKLGILKCRIISLTYAREHLDFANEHDGIIALTGAAADQAAKVYPKAKVAHLAWGADLSFFPQLPYSPKVFLSCGATHRDQKTLSKAAQLSSSKIRVIAKELPPRITWSSNVEILSGGSDAKQISFQELLHQHYRDCAASLIILDHDPQEMTAVGMTNLIEAMAMRRPVIATKTGALPSEVDIEKDGCGLFVPSSDPKALAEAMTIIERDPLSARRMGDNGALLAKTRYNIQRYSQQLHSFFCSMD